MMWSQPDPNSISHLLQRPEPDCDTDTISRSRSVFNDKLIGRRKRDHRQWRWWWRPHGSGLVRSRWSGPETVTRSVVLRRNRGRRRFGDNPAVITRGGRRGGGGKGRRRRWLPVAERWTASTSGGRWTVHCLDRRSRQGFWWFSRRRVTNGSQVWSDSGWEGQRSHGM